MWGIIRHEAITAARVGTRVPLERLCRDIADTVADKAADTVADTPIATTAPDAAALIDEDLLSRLLLGQLRSAGLCTDDGPPLSEAIGGLAVGEELRRWARESVRQLVLRGYLDGDQDRPRPAGPVPDAWAEWDTRSARWAAAPDLRAQVKLLDATLRALPRILTGAVPATDVMFPNSSMELVEGIYRNNPVTDVVNGVLADAAVAVVREILAADPRASVRILEIGAGTGGGSVQVFEGLRPFADRVQTYCYTDLSRSFLMHAEQEYGPHYPYLDYRLLDIEKPLAGQDIEPGGFDLVLATNVLHATRNIRRTLRNAKALLKENGVLLANELSAHSLFTHLTFGLLEGWWLYEDDELRIPGCPGLSPESWTEVLEEEGFDSVSFPATSLHELGHQVFAADSDGVIRQELAPEPEPEQDTQDRSPREDTARPAAVSETATSDDALERHVEDVIFEQVQRSLNVDRTQIDADDAFMDYGVDSIIGVRLIQEINQRLGIDLATSDLFDHRSIHHLARHILDEYRPAALASLPGEATPAEPAAVHAVPEESPAETSTVLHKEPIAVIGMSGRFGGSPDLDALWEHLVRGDDLIERVSRWDLPEPPPGAQVCRHGSFIDDIDRFDPAFFNLSGIEATYMDPQQRVFLEESWKALEDAGYAGAGTQGTRCGVYVGCQESGYAQLFGGTAPAPAMWGNALSAVPARISYHLDLQGPAVSVDTACSSSLVAIHLACQGLWGGETELALAGGVSIQCTPEFYRVAGQAGMLSPTGRCHTFDDRADGFVPGEGAGVLVLKRLADAVADGDHIHGVISGSGINQDGASNGLTAPSAKSQERLETSVYDAFGINPEHIQVLEAHGTGTKLGDPIEHRALQRAFRAYTDRREFCALGSIKSNLGHTITAAGVAGVLKVLLSLRHRRIAPSINFEVGNTHIDFTDSPFYVNTVDRPWEAGGDGKRRAAVSSFGVSGTNAHLVLEEAPQPAKPAEQHPVHLIALSADTAEQLSEQAERLLAHGERNPGLDLAAVSHTLLLGRRHLPYRLACVVRGQQELTDALRQWLATGTDPRVHAGEPPARREQGAALRGFGNDCVRRFATTTDAQTGADLLSSIADLYVQGYELDYAGLFAGARPTRVPLPTYPFARDRYWVPASEPTPTATSALHPLLHVNASTLRAQRYDSTFTGTEFFLTDHVVQGQKVLPGVACLEMARAAAALAEPDRDGQSTLRNVVWARPIAAGAEPLHLSTSLTARDTGELDFEISSAAAGVHSQGQVTRTTATPSTVDLDRLRSSCDRIELTPVELYPMYQRIGFEYGPAHRGLRGIHVGRDEVLVRLTMPDSVRATRDRFVLHPSILDAMLQASLGMGIASGESSTLDVSGMRPSLPFALDELEILGPCADDMWAWIRYSAGTRTDSAVFKLDIDLCDEQGAVRARVRGISYRVLDEDPTGTEPSRVTFLPAWATATPAEPELSRHLVLLADLPDPDMGTDTETVRLTSDATGIAQRFTDYAVQTLECLQQLPHGSPQHPVLVQLAVPEHGEPAAMRGLLGLLTSARMEDPTLLVQAVLVGSDDIAECLRAARRHATSTCVRLRDNEVEALTWTEHDSEAQPQLPWKNGGVYLITGGLGGIGTLVARDMVTEVPDSTVVLTGRSPLGPEQERVLAALREHGGDVRYAAVDVGDAAAVTALIDGIEREHGALHGIVHSAGIVRDNFLGRKTAQECRDVLAPKVAGVVNLDEASKDIPLDFFVSFAAAAGVFGNTGQADYAAANAFLDAYTQHRRDLVRQGRRHGASVSLDWPLWAEGGMGVDASTAAVMREQLGMRPMPTATGIGALHAALDAAHGQVLVIAGDAATIRQTVLASAPRPEQAAPPTRRSSTNGSTGHAGHAKVVGYLREVISEVIQVPVRRLDAASPFEHYGIDSVLALSITNRLEADFGSLPKTLLFEHECIDDLARHLLGAYPDTLASILGTDATPVQQPSEPVVTTAPAPVAPQRTPRPADTDAVAVIGLAGRYPGAADLAAFWENLATAKDCVTEVPADRWDAEQAGDTPRWGGFLDGVAEFDSLLFNVSPSEAALMDPQSRLFLQCVWSLLESSGYTRAALRSRHDGRVGVYVGTMYQQYQLLASDDVHESITSVMSSSAIANRVSHFFDLHGPSMAIDTTCSSSLVAIHMACAELRRGDSELMIAGGVNLSLHPKKYRGLRMTGLMGGDPDSRAFLDGDGFVPAEGVGAVLLKPLSRAVEDGDEILAVIRSSSANHKGRTNGPMVPGVEQQEKLIEENLRRAGVHPRAVSYAEASANGSQLGDAIEFAALRNVFGRHTTDEGFCALGTVKSTLGNLEAASGVAQLSKVALQMRHRKLVAPLRRGRLNPGLELDGTAFYLPEQTEDWQRPVLDGRDHPRLATISAFGAGGANAHLVVEEYSVEEYVAASSDAPEPAGPQLVVFSARTERALHAQAEQMLEFVRAHDDLSLANLAYTLHSGREGMEHRLAMVAEHVKEVVAGLEHYLRDAAPEESPVPLFTGGHGSDLGALLTGAAGDAMLRQLLAEDRPEDIALFWVRGGEVPWRSLHGDTPRRIIATLPTYPFDRQRHWLNPAVQHETVQRETVPHETETAAPQVIEPAPAQHTAPDGIVAAVAEVLGLPAGDLPQDAALDELGFSSILATQLLKLIQRDIDPAAGLQDLAECRSTRDLVRRFGSGKNTAKQPEPQHSDPADIPEVVRLNGSEQGRPVFWFHGGLGGVEVYGAIAASIERPFYGIQARGWMTNSAPLTGIRAMAAHYADILRAVQPDGPFDLGGYSLGGLLAYEVARQLQEGGATVETITMLDAMYGDEVKERTMSRKDMLLQQVNALLQAGSWASTADEPAPFIAGYEVDLSRGDEELLAELLDLAGQRGLNGRPDALRARIWQNVRVLEAYEVLDYEVLPLPRPEEVTCFFFRNDSGLFYGALEPVLSTQDDGKALDHVDYWGEWQRQIPGFHRVDVDSSNHFMILSDEASLAAIRAYCKVAYSSAREKNRIKNAKKWVSRRTAQRKGAI